MSKPTDLPLYALAASPFLALIGIGLYSLGQRVYKVFKNTDENQDVIEQRMRDYNYAPRFAQAKAKEAAFDAWFNAQIEAHPGRIQIDRALVEN